MNATPYTVFSAGLLALTGLADAALIASDNASNYSSWTDGSNAGSGFSPWVIVNNNDEPNIFAGTFLGDSTQGAGNINSSGTSFGMYANPTFASVTAERSFSSSLDIGNVFTFQMALNFDNGVKGMKLLAGVQDEVFSLEVGAGAAVSSLNATLNPGPGAGYDYGGNDAVLDFVFTIDSASSLLYEISRSSSQGFQGVLFSGSVSGLTESISGFGLFVTGTDAGGAAQNNLYVNNFAVIPEPSSLLCGGLGLLACTLRRRRRAD